MGTLALAAMGEADSQNKGHNRRFTVGDMSLPSPPVLSFSADKRVLSSLPLQMSLYFNTCFFPFWWVSESVMLGVKVRTASGGGGVHSLVMLHILCSRKDR